MASKRGTSHVTKTSVPRGNIEDNIILIIAIYFLHRLLASGYVNLNMYITLT